VGQLKEQLEYLTGLTLALCEKGNIDPSIIKPFKIPSPAPNNPPSPATTLGVELKVMAVTKRTASRSRSSDKASDRSGGSRGSRGSRGSSKSPPLFYL